MYAHFFTSEGYFERIEAAIEHTKQILGQTEEELTETQRKNVDVALAAVSHTYTKAIQFEMEKR